MSSSLLNNYLQSKSPSEYKPETLAYLASLEVIGKDNPQIVESILSELKDQRSSLKMIASENYCSLAVQLTLGNLLTDKYAEGYPQHRFYAGCDNIDTIESLAIEKAKKLFGAHHAYVQPHSGADANLVAFWTILTKRFEDKFFDQFDKKTVMDFDDAQWEEYRQAVGNQKLMGLSLDCGGHLTHGFRQNLSAKMFKYCAYGVNPETQLIDYDEVRKIAKREKPLILLGGYSAYPRKINFKIFREIADEVGAVLMVDMAHFAGLVAGKVFTGDFDPVAHAQIVTSTTHKTLRGPRGGIILTDEEFATTVDRGCPMALGGPLSNAMAAKAVAFEEASTDSYKEYAQKVVDNARVLGEALIKEGIKITTNGTDNHLIVADITSFGITGRQGEGALREAGVTLNRNSIPFDPNGAWYTSGLRLGTPALTSRGFGEDEMKTIASVIKKVLSCTAPKTTKSGKPSKATFSYDESIVAAARAEVDEMLSVKPLYPELDF
ncbi:MAG: serine hydroxymethyltransferase [Planctomycetota bacterium]|nr:MAG: serine hydroxymethyltransferase [Planctomycetota bacterium]